MPEVKENEEDEASEQRRRSVLWPSAADGSSGLRARSGSAWSDAELVPGRALGAYELLSPIGTTAYGRAFRARHTLTGREVALHFLPGIERGDESLAHALPLAVAKGAQLSHPNVIALEEHGQAEDAGGHYLVTQALEGVSLVDCLEQTPVLPLPRALSITMQVGRALRAAHKLGIVHGALAPGNVRMVQSEQGELVRVVGFGCDLFAFGEAAAERPARAPSPYDAPEVRRGAVPDARSDVFAVGSLLFRMLTGSPPSSAEGAAPSLSAACAEPVPRALDELLARCLEPRPEARLVDAVSLTRELRQIARRIDTGLRFEDAASEVPDQTDPSYELGSPDGDSAGSLIGAHAALRRSLLWIALGLLVALATVWLVWYASGQSGRDRARLLGPAR